MSRLNDEFLEIYKRIDAFCRDTYKSDKGVTSYIDEMSRIAGASWGVLGWNETLTKLKNYRHIRNSYTHDVGTSYTDICTHEDVEWLQSFYDKLMSAQDPISLYTQKKQASSKTASSVYIRVKEDEPKEENVIHYQEVTPATSYRQDEPRKSKRGCLIFFLVFIVFIVLIVLLILALFGFSVAVAVKFFESLFSLNNIIFFLTLGDEI